MINHTLGVILAGGQARRMGGGDKGLLDLGGKTLLAEVISRLAPQCDTVVLNANGDPDRFCDIDITVIPDSVSGYPGPLAGVLAGMDYAAQLGLSYVLTAAADTPFLPRDLGARLHNSLQTDAQPIALAATRDGDRVIRQPTFGLWPVVLRDDLRQAITSGVSKVVLWTDRHGMSTAVFDTDQYDPFFNVNTPEDLIEARRMWRTM